MQEQRHRKLYYVHTHGLHYAHKRPHIPMKSIHTGPGVFNQTLLLLAVSSSLQPLVINYYFIPGPAQCFACTRYSQQH
jgi:hypothetical protein